MYRQQRSRTTATLATTAIVSLFAMTACGSEDTTPNLPAESTAATESTTTTDVPASGILVTGAWSRIARDDLGAAYFAVRNDTGETIRLTAASSSLAMAVEIHETTMADDGTMKMSEVEDGFEIAAGEELVLKPGGKHLMLMGFSPGDATDVDLRLDFDGTFVDVVAPIDFEQSGMMHGGGSSGMHGGGSSDDDAAALEGAEWVDGDLESILGAMDIARLHDIDDELAAGNLDAASQLPDTQRALAVARTAEWPIDVDPMPLISALGGLEMALEMGNLQMAAMHAAEVHDLAHDLEPGHS